VDAVGQSRFCLLDDLDEASVTIPFAAVRLRVIGATPEYPVGSSLAPYAAQRGAWDVAWLNEVHRFLMLLRREVLAHQVIVQVS